MGRFYSTYNQLYHISVLIIILKILLLFCLNREKEENLNMKHLHYDFFSTKEIDKFWGPQQVLRCTHFSLDSLRVLKKL